jgi:hypothetical protein
VTWWKQMGAAEAAAMGDASSPSTRAFQVWSDLNHHHDRLWV